MSVSDSRGSDQVSPRGFSLSSLRTGVQGRVIGPNDPDYDQARRVFYSHIDRRPAAIVRVADEADIAYTIAVAREAGLELAVRSGGHSIAGYGVSDGGIVIDLRDMRALEIDPEGRTAWAQTGMTTGEFITGTTPHGLATGFGDTASVGIGGLTLGGGIGFLVRKLGLTIDSLLAADIVTADGQLLRADAESHPDLFWAVRGGGGNFGVATRFHFRLHEVGTVLGGMLMLPATPHAIASLAAEAEAAPEELSVIANIFRAGPMLDLPAEWHGRFVIMALLVYAGPIDDGLRAAAPLRSVDTPIADLVRPMPYPEIFAFTEGGPAPAQEAARSSFVDRIDLAAAEAIIQHMEASTAPDPVIQLRVFGGAMARVPPGATAFAHRDRWGLVAAAALYQEPEEAPRHEAWLAGLMDALPTGKPGVYVNFLGDEGRDRVQEAYPNATWRRLAAIKTRYDPANVFQLNQNVPPMEVGELK